MHRRQTILQIPSLGGFGRFDIQVVADLSNEILLDLTMSRNGGHFAVTDILKDGVATTLSYKAAAILLEVPYQLTKLHYAAFRTSSSFVEFEAAETLFSASSR